MTYYVSYGSNINLNQMAYRCPGYQILSVTQLKDYRLVFRGIPDGYLTLEREKGCIAPAVLYRITAEDERNLDLYEGFPWLYYKKSLQVMLPDGRIFDAFMYLMHVGYQKTIPSPEYYSCVLEGYQMFGFNQSILEEAYEYSMSNTLTSRLYE